MTDQDPVVHPVDMEQLNALFEVFVPKLIRQAEQRIAQRYKSKFGGDDIAATVCRTIVRRCQDGVFRFADDAELWRLMTTIALRKISNKVRAENTQGRSIDRQVSLDPDIHLALSREPDPATTNEFVDLLDNLCQKLDEEMIEVLNQRSQGRSLKEIADSLGHDVRRVSRKLKVIREELERLA